jgi:hypothetical protein
LQIKSANKRLSTVAVGYGGTIWFREKEPLLVYYYLSLQLLPLARMGLLLVGAKGEEQLLDK